MQLPLQFPPFQLPAPASSPCHHRGERAEISGNCGLRRDKVRPTRRRSCGVTPESPRDRRSSMSQTATSAPKNGLKGLAIERRFSSAGTHPFDEIEWETRDAVIGNPESPAFEQRGVEFPKSWSQNATNIVAQKYFRGQLGSDK